MDLYACQWHGGVVVQHTPGAGEGTGEGFVDAGGWEETRGFDSLILHG